MSLAVQWRSGPYRVRYISVLIWAFLAIPRVAAHHPASGVDLILCLAAAVFLTVATLWSFVPLVRWPYNPLGYLLMTEGDAATPIPESPASMSSPIKMEWERRFGAASLSATENFWRFERRVAASRIFLVVTLATSIVAFGTFAIAGFLIPLLAGVVVLARSRRAGADAKQEARQVIAAHLGIGPFTDFPALDPARYRRWLADHQPSPDADAPAS